ncbi:hypothetical protein ABZ154_34420, partial [Streptomyces sp. NPDC006261]|uniref:hypothetical protein n=1 Tax=Streptomyces sp. NPDC006261 TaxID=3156739 RepID=UPI00339E67F2
MISVSPRLTSRSRGRGLPRRSVRGARPRAVVREVRVVRDVDDQADERPQELVAAVGAVEPVA